MHVALKRRRTSAVHDSVQKEINRTHEHAHIKIQKNIRTYVELFCPVVRAKMVYIMVVALKGGIVHICTLQLVEGEC